MPKSGTFGSVRGVLGNRHSYRDPGRLGRSPMVPEETCAFWARIATVMSLVDRPKPTSLAGSSQMRIARSVPNSSACPTPGSRWISGSTLRAA